MARWRDGAGAVYADAAARGKRWEAVPRSQGRGRRGSVRRVGRLAVRRDAPATLVCVLGAVNTLYRDKSK